MTSLTISRGIPFGFGEDLDLLTWRKGEVDVDLHPVRSKRKRGRENNETR